MYRRIIAAALLCAMLALTSCGTKTDTSAGGTSAPETDAAPAGTTDVEGAARIDPGLPDRDFEGYTFTFLSHHYTGDDWVTDRPLEILAEAENAEPINDAVYARNLKIKEKYNIDIALALETDEKSALTKSVRAGDEIYDAAIMFNNNIPGIITSGLLMQIGNLPYVDLSKPWWDPAARSMSITGKDYLLVGDLLILDNEATNALIFNKDMMTDYGMELPYQLVLDGKWTFDKFNEYIKQVSGDVDGDGKMTASDRYGLISYNDTMHALLVAGGGAFAEKNAEDIPVMTIGTPHNISVLEKAMDILYNSTNVMNYQKFSDIKGGLTIGQQYYKTFEENRALFMWMRMRVVEVFRGMDSNFGIIPLPKFDENQKDYRSVVNPYTGVMMAIPKTCSDPERTSIILEALCAESRYTLQPAYYDVVLTRKFARDEESKAMLDIIFSNRIYDIGAAYGFADIFNQLNAVILKDDRNITSFIDRNTAKWDAAINKVVTIFNEID